ncbi:hypothetical protein ABN287_01790 [Escherichia coli]
MLISESAWEEMTCLFAPSLDNRGSIKGKLNNIYGKSIDYAALRHRDIIIAKIDLFIQRITHNLWHARKKMCF